MRRIARVAAALALFGAFANAAPAASASKPQTGVGNQPAMRFTLTRARTPGCEPNCPEWIAAEGAFVKGSAEAFRAALAKLNGGKPPILFHSGGGSVTDAMQIGAMIRKAGLDTAVARADATGAVLPGGCLSACPLAFAGGVRRYSPPGARVGVHRVQSRRTMVTVHRRFLVKQSVTPFETTTEKTLVDEKRTTKTTVREGSSPELAHRLKTHLETMGVSTQMVALMDSTPFSDMRDLFQAEQQSLRLATHFESVLRLLDPARAPAGHAGAGSVSTVARSVGGGRLPLRIEMTRSLDEDFVNLILIERRPFDSLAMPLAFERRRIALRTAQIGGIAVRKPEGVVMAAAPRVAFCAAARGRGYRLNLNLRFGGGVRLGYPIDVDGHAIIQQAASLFDAACKR